MEIVIVYSTGGTEISNALPKTALKLKKFDHRDAFLAAPSPPGSANSIFAQITTPKVRLHSRIAATAKEIAKKRNLTSIFLVARGCHRSVNITTCCHGT